MNIRTTLGKSSPKDLRAETCPYPHNWYICSCGAEFGNWEYPTLTRCVQCGEVCEPTDNPAREAWFAAERNSGD